MDRSLAAGLLYSFTVGFLCSEKSYYLLDSEIKCRSLIRAANDDLFQIKLVAKFYNLISVAITGALLSMNEDGVINSVKYTALTLLLILPLPILLDF
jgi:hypothetical protein